MLNNEGPTSKVTQWEIGSCQSYIDTELVKHTKKFI